MAKPKPLNLPQLAYAFKSGALPSDKMPERIRAKVKRFAEAHPLDQLQAMATPHQPIQRTVGHIYAKPRNARTG